MFKKIFMVATAGLLITSCGGGNSNNDNSYSEDETTDFSEVIDATEDALEEFEGVTESLGAIEEVVENIDIETEEEAEEETSTTSTASNDFDEVLDSYEEYVDQYVSYMKKAANGDMSALTEYPALMEKAQEVSKKLEDSKDEMSAAQASRYMQITNKMTAAATQMQ